MYQYDVETDQRVDSLYSGGIGFSPRTFLGPSGEAIPADGLFSIDGIPSSLQDGRVFHEKKRSARKERWHKRMKQYPLSLAWVALLLTVGAVIQAVH